MIVAFEELKTHRGKVTMVDGAFDPLHLGHLEYFERAGGLELPLLCNLAPDRYLEGKHHPLLPAIERAKIIDALRAISYVHVNSLETDKVLEELRPKYYVKGDDWNGKLPKQQVDICKQFGIEIIYLDSVRDSSTGILRRFLAHHGVQSSLENYEAFTLSQKEPGSQEFTAEYFTDSWRSEGNAYDVETRRKMEGRNPQLIKEVFQPRRVVDMGCGPGALMYLLQEVGITADGVDFSATSKEIAPPEVAERICIGSITDIDLPENSYDLVICREVFEHMPVLLVQKAVQNLARVSSRFIYVTTRFHPNPTSLFDVTTEFDVDPTHITCMNKDMLRLMFVLQGFRRRGDLEARMDWLNKNRVLVYEKVRP
jgi:glycerol-3-phosphate cytidylyltransferase-like family protein/SAM-dependent methyltransferase